MVPNGGGERTFVHIRQFQNCPRRPGIGDKVTYSLSKDSRGRLQARAVSYVDKITRSRPSASVFPRRAIGLVALLAVAASFFSGILPVVVTGSYVVFSGLSFLLYRADKAAAKKGTWRTAEQTLHIFDLLGGWPGGLMAQQRFRHKTAKLSFQMVFWLSVIGNIGGVWWLIRSGTAAQLSGAFIG